MTTLTQLIEQYCPDGVEHVELKEVLKYEQPGKYLVSSTDYDDGFSTPVLTAGKTFVLGYTDETTGIYEASPDDPVIIFDDFTTSFKWVDFPFKAKSSAMKMLTPTVVDSSFRYIFYAMHDVDVDVTDHKRQWIRTYSKEKIPLPPREVQDAIVERLDAFAKLIQSLDSEIALREKQFEYFREQLLTFDESDGVEYVKLGNVGQMLMCKRIFKRETAEHGDVPFFKIGTFGKEPDAFISRALFDEYRNKFSYPRKGELLISASGSIGRIVEFDGQDAYYQDSNIVWLRHDESRLLNRFLKHCYAEVEWYTEGGTIKRLYGKNLHNTVVPLPTLEVQQDIADKLDTMQALIDNLKQERELRKSQFEYYREKLLTFNS